MYPRGKYKTIGELKAVLAPALMLRQMDYIWCSIMKDTDERTGAKEEEERRDVM
jgi:hypothetical protein